MKISSELIALRLACSICSANELIGYYKATKKKNSKDQAQRLDVILSVAKMRNIKVTEDKV